MLYFFLRADDGIRDGHVTGVQACALPISSAQDVESAKPDPDLVHTALDAAGVPAERAVFVGDTVWDVEAAERAGVPAEIGRASCRARVSARGRGAGGRTKPRRNPACDDQH